jgi:hypothetical protein
LEVYHPEHSLEGAAAGFPIPVILGAEQAGFGDGRC